MNRTRSFDPSRGDVLDELRWLKRVTEDDTQNLYGRLISEIEQLRADHARYAWLANAVLAYDYGDNNHGGSIAGWCVCFDRLDGEPFIFGRSIDAAIDAAIATEARRAETVKLGSVHEGAGPQDIAHTQDVTKGV